MDTALIGIIAITSLFSYQGFQDNSFFRKYEFHIGSIRSGEHYRMFTSALLHADIPHLVFNMITLYFFAPVVSGYLGMWIFVLIYVASLIFGSLLTLLIHREEYGYRAIGASGAVMGIVYSSILLEPNSLFYGFIPAYIFGIFYLFYSIYGMRSRRDNIGHTAHFGGAVGGYVMTLAYDRILFTERPLIVIILAIPIVILFIMERRGKL